MKQGIPFRIFAALLAVLFMAVGCPSGVDGPSGAPEEVRDDPAQGL